MKRLLALFLALIMVCTLLPVSALAAGTDTLTVSGKEYTASASGTGWSWDAAKKTLTLSGYDGSAIKYGGDLTVVLKGANTISLAKDAKSGISVGGKLTINKTSSSASDTLTIKQTVAASPSNLIQTGKDDEAHACVINGGTVTLKNEVVGGTGTGIANMTVVNNDARLNITAPYRGVGSTLKTNTSGAVTVTTNGSNSFAAAVCSLDANGTGTVTLNAPTPAVTVCESLNIASTAGKVVLNGYTKVANDPVDNYSVAHNKKVQGVDNYYEGSYTTDPRGNPGYYLCDSSGQPLSSATYQTVDGQPLAIMDSKLLDLSGLKVGTKYESTVAVINATRGGSGGYVFSVASGKLPAGLTMDAKTGRISGTPSAASEAGSFVVSVKDSKGTTAQVTINYSAVKASEEFLYVDYSDNSSYIKFNVKTDKEGLGWSYTASNKTLTLKGYNAGPIKCDTDLNIVLSGTNTVTLPGPASEGISVNGKLTITKTNSTLGDTLTVKQTTTTTSADLIVTGSAGQAQSLEVNGGTVNLVGAAGATGTSGITNWAYVNNDARLNITAAYRGAASRLIANTSGDIRITVNGVKDGAAAAYLLNTSGSGSVTLSATGTATTVYNALTVASTSGSVALNGYTKVSATPYNNFSVASNKTLQGNNAYYFGYRTSTATTGSGYYLTDSAGKPLESAVIASKANLPLTIMDSAMFDLPATMVGIKLNREIYLSCATYGGAGGYSYSIKSGSALPAGLTVNKATGAISGTPTSSASAGSFVVVVTDKAGATAEVTINYGKISVDKVGVPSVTGSNDPDTGKPRFTWNPVDGAAKYEVYRSGTKDGTYSLYCTTTGTSYTNTSASAGSTYYYKVRAIGYDGRAGSYSAIKERTCDCARPVVTAGNNATSGKVTLKWTAVTGAKSYAIYRSTSIDGTYTKMYTTTSTSYTNSTSKGGVTYYYKVVALSSRTTYADSAAALVGPCVCKCAAPTVTSGNNASSGKITLKWSAVEGATKYEIWRSGTKNGTYTRMYTTTSTGYTNSTSYAGYTYYYKVKAVCGTNAAANSEFSAIKERTCDCARPVVKISLNNGDPRLTWDKVYNADSYTVYRATTANGTYSKMYTTKYTSYTNTSAVAGKTYYYKIVANCSRSSYATSAYSNVVHILAK